MTGKRECLRTSRRESLNIKVLGDGGSDSGCCAGAAREERRHEVKDEERSEGSAIARVKGVCSQQTIQRMMSLVSNAMRQGETDGDGEVKKKAWPTAGSVIDHKQQAQSGTRSQNSRGSRRT